MSENENTSQKKTFSFAPFYGIGAFLVTFIIFTAGDMYGSWVVALLFALSIGVAGWLGTSGFEKAAREKDTVADPA
ncbi:hypothetical protein [Corynebacterium frankenforstense]